MIDIKQKYPHARELPKFASGEGNEVWREVARTVHDDHPCARFTYVADRLIAEDRFRDRAIELAQAVHGRCFEKDGDPYYRFEPRVELDPKRLAAVHHNLDGVGAYGTATFKELVPQPPWMDRQTWALAFRRYVEAATGEDDCLRRPRHLNTMFGNVPTPALQHFFMAARGVLPGGLVHKPLMGDLTYLLALAGAIAAANYQDGFYRISDYLAEALKTPPLIAAKEDGGFHLIHLCRD